MKPRRSSRFRKQNPSASLYGIRTKLKIFGNMENVLRRAIPRQVWSGTKQDFFKRQQVFP